MFEKFICPIFGAGVFGSVFFAQEAISASDLTVENFSFIAAAACAAAAAWLYRSQRQSDRERLAEKDQMISGLSQHVAALNKSIDEKDRLIFEKIEENAALRAENSILKKD